jgi:hypothetical protein
LDDISVRTFGIFLTWLYSGILELPADSTAHLACKCLDGDNSKADTHNDDASSECPRDLEWDLLDLHVLADKYDFVLLRRGTMIVIQHLSTIRDTSPNLEFVCEAYDSLPDNSPLCQWLVDMYKLWWHLDKTSCPCQPPNKCECFGPDILPSAFMYQLLMKSHYSNQDSPFVNKYMDL